MGKGADDRQVCTFFPAPKKRYTKRYTKKPDVTERSWTLLDNKKPAEPCAVRVFGLSWTALDFFVVPGAGLEPAHLAAGDFESPASTNFATRAKKSKTRIV